MKKTIIALAIAITTSAFCAGTTFNFTAKDAMKGWGRTKGIDVSQNEKGVKIVRNKQKAETKIFRNFKLLPGKYTIKVKYVGNGPAVIIQKNWAWPPLILAQFPNNAKENVAVKTIELKKDSNQLSISGHGTTTISSLEIVPAK